MTPNPPVAYGSGMHIGRLHVLGWPASTPVLLRTPGSVCAKAIPGNSGATRNARSGADSLVFIADPLGLLGAPCLPDWTYSYAAVVLGILESLAGM